MKTKLAMFDLDGTLYNTCLTNYYAYKDALKQYRYELDYDYYLNECNGRHYTEFLPRMLGNNENIDEIHAIKKARFADYLDKCIENNYLFDIINGLKRQYYIALITTASRKNCEEILTYHKRLNLFDLIISQEDVEKYKPNPEGFLKAMEYFGIYSESSIVFEDSEVGVKAAMTSGATVFVVKGFS